MGVLTAKELTNRTGTIVVPVKELAPRIIKRYENTYTSGAWNPNNSFNWAPGSYVDFTPLRADSRISYMWRAPHYWSNTGHAISHWRFYVNGQIYYYHSVSGTYIEDGNVIKWDVPSWGTSSGRIGYTIRSYANDNHEVRLYGTRYWNGGGSTQNSYGQLIVEEYTNTGSAPYSGTGTVTLG